MSVVVDFIARHAATYSRLKSCMCGGGLIGLMGLIGSIGVYGGLLGKRKEERGKRKRRSVYVYMVVSCAIAHAIAHYYKR